MIYVPIFLLAVVCLWLSYCFVQGFIQGFREGWQRTRWRQLKGVWRQCKRENPRRER